MRTLLVALVFLLLPYIVVGASKLPRSLFAEAALHGLENWRLKKWLAGSGAYPEDTHFDGLDWEVGLTEVVCHVLVVENVYTNRPTPAFATTQGWGHFGRNFECNKQRSGEASTVYSNAYHVSIFRIMMRHLPVNATKLVH